MDFYITVRTKNTMTLQINHAPGAPIPEVEAAALEHVRDYIPGGGEFEVAESKRRGHLSDATTVGTTVRLRRKGTPPTKKRPYKAPIC